MPSLVRRVVNGNKGRRPPMTELLLLMTEQLKSSCPGIHVDVLNIENSTGIVACALFDSPNKFPQKFCARQGASWYHKY
jgi:hypothetical protein